MSPDRLTDEQLAKFEAELTSEIFHIVTSLQLPKDWRFTVRKASQWDYLNCVEVNLYFGDHRELKPDEAPQAALAFIDMARLLDEIHPVRIFREPRTSTYRVNGLFREFTIVVLASGEEWVIGSMNKVEHVSPDAFGQLIMAKADADFESDREFSLKMEHDKIASAERAIARLESMVPPSARRSTP